MIDHILHIIIFIYNKINLLNNKNMNNYLRYSMSSLARVGFVGTGNMGGPMAINLAKKGYEVFAFDTVFSEINLRCVRIFKS